MIKKNVILSVGVLFLLLLLTSPFWIWQLKTSEDLNVLIIDKTVPDQSYREHKGLIWILNHLKLKKDGSTYDQEDDYVGFVPTDNPPVFHTRELPEDLSSYDLLYVADGYGVYEDEYMGGNQEGKRSKLQKSKESHLLKGK